MNQDVIDKIYRIVKAIPVTKNNKEKLDQIKEMLDNEQIEEAVYEIKKLPVQNTSSYIYSPLKLILRRFNFKIM